MIRIVKYITIVVLLISCISGCNSPVYEKNIEKVYSMLKLNMTKEELLDLFKGFTLIKKQTILVKATSTEEKERRSLLRKKEYYDSLYPENLFDKISLTGDVKVYSYYVRKTLAWPNGWDIQYIMVFYDEKNNKIIGWGKATNNNNYIKTWGNTF